MSSTPTDTQQTSEGLGPRLEEKARNARAHRHIQAWPERGEKDTADARARTRRAVRQAEARGPRVVPVHEPRPKVLREEPPAPAPAPARPEPVTEQDRFQIPGGCLDCEADLWTDSARPRVPLCGHCAKRRHRKALEQARERRLRLEEIEQARARRAGVLGPGI